jgi:integrase
MAQAFGTIRQTAAGRFQARYRLNGAQVTAGTFDSADAAREALDGIQVDMRRGDHWDDRKSKTKFAVYMADYMALRQSKVAPGTFHNDRSYLRRHLMPAFGAMALRDIDVQSIDSWWNGMPATQTRRNAYFLLKKALDYAVRWGYLRANPAMVEEPGREVAKMRPTWSYKAFCAVLEHVPTSVALNNAKGDGAPVPVFYREALQVLFAGHLRLGELIALDAADYDRKTGILSVTHQITGHSRGERVPTKTGQVKHIRLLKLGIDALAAMPPRIGGPLFLGPRSGRLPRATLRDAWNSAVKAAELENFHLHDLRHVSLTLVAQAGESLKVIQDRGGHASVTAAMRYQHVDPERDAAAARAVDALLASSR